MNYLSILLVHSMKKILKSLLIVSTLLLILTFLPVLVHGQLPDPSCDPLDPGCPIDGGIGILLAAGIGYGIKKVRNANRAQIATPRV